MTSYSEKYRITDHRGLLVVLCYARKYNADEQCYEDVVAIRDVEVFKAQ